MESKITKSSKSTKIAKRRSKPNTVAQVSVMLSSPVNFIFTPYSLFLSDFNIIFSSSLARVDLFSF